MMVRILGFLVVFSSKIRTLENEDSYLYIIRTNVKLKKQSVYEERHGGHKKNSLKKSLILYYQKVLALVLIIRRKTKKHQNQCNH